MQNDRIRVYDIQEGAFTSEPQTHPTLYAPHGLYPNPSGTHAATPQYWFDHHTVGIWTLDSLTGSPSFGFAIQMADSGGTGAYQHTVRWLDDSRFYVTVTQEATQGNGTSQQGIWMGNLATRSAVQVLDESDILEGVSDCGIAGSKLYVAEGNVAKFLAGEATPGHLSIWDITSPESPTLIRRLSAGSGFPDDFANAHSIGIPLDGSSVFVESFSSHYLIQVDHHKRSGQNIRQGGWPRHPARDLRAALIAREPLHPVQHRLQVRWLGQRIHQGAPQPHLAIESGHHDVVGTAFQQRLPHVFHMAVDPLH